MNYAYFIAKRLSGRRNKNFSRLIVRIATAGVALSVTVMIVSISIVTGFQHEIRDKIIGFGSHIQIAHIDLNNSYETAPVYRHQEFIKPIKSLPDFNHIQVFATKAGIIRTKTDMEAIVLKGIGTDFNWTFFNTKLTKGHKIIPNDSVPTDEVLISKFTADKLRLDTGQKLIVYFIQEPVRVRSFIISGIYETGLEEFDKIYMICDLGHIQKLNDWSKTMVGGFEIQLKQFDHLDENTERVNYLTGYEYEAKSIKEINPNLFDWLDLLDVNVIVIIGLLLVVSVINMVTALLILILERTHMIGLLKTFGSGNIAIGKIFFHVSARLLFNGLVIGNVIGIGLCLLQQYTQLFTLDQANYYMSSVPVNLRWQDVLLLNAGTFTICLLCMILPSLYVSRISPLKSIRFE
ncbi:MAG: ABC transporter permease [Bacteroidia bacterium]|nr:ABC transporter permease [Bacteroidia bacterium]